MDGVDTQMKWYEDYDQRSCKAIKEARDAIKLREQAVNTGSRPIAQPHVKLAKLEMQYFSSDYRNYLKWKSQFERYTKHCDDEVKYDYLYNYTKGNAHRIVTGTQKYSDAMLKLDKEFRDVNYILKLLIDDIRALNVVRKGDTVSFVNLSHEINKFRDRLTDMGKANEVENSYVLQEIESKLNNEDKHK